MNIATCTTCYNPTESANRQINHRAPKCGTIAVDQKTLFSYALFIALLPGFSLMAYRDDVHDV
jgi:hypothetical protein